MCNYSLPIKDLFNIKLNRTYIQFLIVSYALYLLMELIVFESHTCLNIILIDFSDTYCAVYKFVYKKSIFVASCI